MSLYFDDLTPGLRFTSRPVTMSADEIIGFARAYDPQPFHTDPEAAADGFFAGLAASGWHTAATTMRLMVESVPIAGGLIGASVEISWTRPVRPGDELVAVSEVLELMPSRSKPERGMAVVRTETRDRSGQAVQVIICKMVVPRRPV
ncbi:MaoC family dehydratase [Acidocella sp.]|uniref:MaoC family dehydratase n=1 Tax=Acidocella sp. TaxID=50710 RepID=UPI0026393836|nr:MaoC family dehydratase [Acidocella sp.]